MKTVNEYQKQFQTWQLEYEAKKNQADRLFSRISTFRIVTFLLGAAGVIIGITEKEKSYAPALTVLGLLLLAGFVALVRWHGVVAERQQLLADKWEVCKRYTARYSDAWRKFEENGTTYKKESDCVAEDIDLLGENSLYQMLSVCHTEKGKVRFAESLTTRYVDEEQQIIRNLRLNLKLREDVWKKSRESLMPRNSNSSVQMTGWENFRHLRT